MGIFKDEYVRRTQSQGGYFIAPNELLTYDLDPMTKLVFMYITAQSPAWVFYVSGIASALGATRKTVARSIERLEEHDMLVVNRSKRSLTITVLPHEEWVKPSPKDPQSESVRPTSGDSASESKLPTKRVQKTHKASPKDPLINTKTNTIEKKGQKGDSGEGRGPHPRIDFQVSSSLDDPDFEALLEASVRRMGSGEAQA